MTASRSSRALASTAVPRRATMTYEQTATTTDADARANANQEMYATYRKHATTTARFATTIGIAALVVVMRAISSVSVASKRADPTSSTFRNPESTTRRVRS